ncbi:ATP-binding protein [Arhodomonas sp. AD133]|uniref:ATP-binding protein n=1 Tax=Arhodomonas sp. AD133 TaxID=3415009 RepID=UPI003EBCB0D0
MRFDLGTLFVSAIAYLLLLFLIAYGTERGRWTRRLAAHPAVYVLSLGVYATTWSYYGAVGFADRQGIGFVTIYLGVALAMALTPLLLMPLLRLTRHWQLTSLADIFAFRFNSQAAGVIVTLLMLTGSLPYLALQIRAVAESTQVLSGEASPGPIAVGFCVLVSVFAIIFGARHVTPREKHVGLVAAIAFESLIKLIALLLVAMVAVSMAFDGIGGIQTWLDAHPRELERFYAPMRGEAWGGLLFLAFSAAFLLPRQFHMLFTENLRPRALLTASWGFPLYLLLLSLAVPPILWAGNSLDPGTVPDYYVLGMAILSDSPVLALVAYLGGISAASAMIIVTTLALSSMSLNHLLLPLVGPTPQHNLYAALRWARRTLIVAIIAAGYLFFLLLERSEGLVSWGLISFLAMAQFVPGVVGVLLWSRATRSGFVAGLMAGGAIWGAAVLLPALTTISPVVIVGLDVSRTQGADFFATVAFWSVSINAAIFALVSLATRPTPREAEAAAACRDVSTAIPEGALQLDSPAQFVEQLAPVTGGAAARAEVAKALADQGIDWQESRPDRLQQLREQIERNLSGMMGPILARMIVDERLRVDTDTRTALAQNVRLIEERLERSRSRFRGLAAELDDLRRYHRQILEDLPLGVAAVTPAARIVRWNPAMQALTRLPSGRVIGRRVEELPAPWGPLLAEFLDADENHAYKRPLELPEETRWLSLHRAFIGGGRGGTGGDRLLLVEDVTELQRLERELTHSERLASIGRLAAGVAHEIGNPVTGVACLAQELRAGVPNAELPAYAEDILAQTQRINTIVQTLVSYAHAGRREEQAPVPVDIADALEEALRVIRLSKRAREVSIHQQASPGLRVQGDLQRLVQVFVNLLTNAVDACGEDGDIHIACQARRGRIEVRITDNGPGIPAGIRDKVLEPFFTTKAPGQGTGLGLPLVYNILREHGGELRLRERRGRRRGTVALVVLPALDATDDQPTHHGATHAESADHRG